MLHPFIFTPGHWKGEGTISFSMAEDILEFTTEWTVLPQEDDKIYFYQIVEVQESPEKMRNQFYIDEIEKSRFKIHLENQIVGKVKGQGILTPDIIAWEFKDKSQQFEGYEIYEFKEGFYKIKAEFTAGEDLKTIIQGFIRPVAL